MEAITAEVLPYQQSISIAGLLDKIKIVKGAKAEEKEKFSEFKEFLEKKWYLIKGAEREKLLPLKIYLDLKKKNYCDALFYADKLENDLAERLKNHLYNVTPAITPEKIVYNLKEFCRKLAKKPTEHETLEHELCSLAKNSIGNYSAKELEENLKKGEINDMPKKRLYDMVCFAEKNSYIKAQETYGFDKKSIYQARNKVKNELIGRIKSIINEAERNNEYTPKEIVYRQILQTEKEIEMRMNRRTLKRLSFGEIEKIHLENKNCRINAEEIARKHHLSNKYVVYAVNRKFKEMEKQAEHKNVVDYVPAASLENRPSVYIPYQQPSLPV